MELGIPHYARLFRKVGSEFGIVPKWAVQISPHAARQMLRRGAADKTTIPVDVSSTLAIIHTAS